VDESSSDEQSAYTLRGQRQTLLRQVDICGYMPMLLEQNAMIHEVTDRGNN
jgi:hypothetical protein